MKISEAMALIKKGEKKVKVKKVKEITGFMVHFEKRGRSILTSGYFPDKHAGEKLIKTEDKAWELAKRFAEATSEKEYINIYVIDHNFRPVGSYASKKIRPL